jgi:RNA polymerase sigma-70 factor (ECF subfamily)
VSGVQRNRDYYNEYRQFLADLGEDNSVSHSRLKQNLRRAISEELTEKERLTLELYYLRGIKMQEIARMLGVNQSTVCRNLSRAKGKLKRCLRYGARELLDENTN